MEIFGTFGLEAILTKVIDFTPKVVAACVVWVVFVMAYKVSHEPLRKVLIRAKLDTHLISILIDNIYRLTLYTFGGVMAVSQLGVDVGAALAGIGVVGIAVGFAAQDTLSNIIAGFLIFLDKPFRVGDWISVKGEYGCVRDITMRSTRIRTLQNTYVIIPNKVIADEVLNNHSKHGETRVDINIGIAYKEFIPEARRVLLAAIDQLDDVLKKPAPKVVVKELADSSINLLVTAWVQDASKEVPVFYAVSEACKLALDEAGIEIPFPHLQLFVDDVKSKVWKQAASTIAMRRAESVGVN